MTHSQRPLLSETSMISRCTQVNYTLHSRFGFPFRRSYGCLHFWVAAPSAMARLWLVWLVASCINELIANPPNTLTTKHCIVAAAASNHLLRCIYTAAPNHSTSLQYQWWSRTNMPQLQDTACTNRYQKLPTGNENQPPFHTPHHTVAEQI